MKRIFVIRIFILLIFISLFIISCANADDNTISPTNYGEIIYVSTSGKNTNKGTKNSPLATIQKAVDMVKKDRRTIYIAGGVYNERITLDYSGSVSIPIVIEGGYNDSFTKRNRNYNTILGERSEPVDGNPGRIYINQYRKLTIRNLTINGTLRAGDAYAIYSEGDLIVDNCVITGFIYDPIGFSSSETAYGIYSGNDGNLEEFLRMKIAYLFGSLNRGGTETLFLDIFKNGSNANFEFIGIHRKDGSLKNDFYKAVPTFFKLSPKFPYDLFYFFKLRKILQKENIQIVHAQQYLDAFYAWTACWGTNIKIVLTFHGYDSPDKTKKSKLLAFIAKRTDRNIFVSRSQRKFYIEKYGLKPDRQRVVYNGVSFGKLDDTYEMPGFLKKMDPSQAGLKMAMVGNFVRGREQHCICRFLKLLHDEGVAFDFYFAGARNGAEPWRYDDCVQYCRENGLSGCVHFLGSRNDVPAILRNMDAFVYSTDHDTFGIAVMEAIAAGVPVFVNDWEVMAEITNHGEWATIYKTQDERDLLEKFGLFLQNRDEYKNKALEAAQKVRQQFSIERHIRELNDVYLNN